MASSARARRFLASTVAFWAGLDSRWGMTSTTTKAISLGELLGRWQSREGLSDASRHREAWSASLVIAHFDGERPAGSLSRRALEDWATLVAESLAESSARVTIAFLRSALVHGLEAGLLERNIASALRLRGRIGMEDHDEFERRE